MTTITKTPSVRSLAKKETKERRNSMLIKVLTFKLQKNKLSQDKKHYLNLLKLEAKYFYNYLIGLSQQSTVDDFGNIVYPNNLFQFNTKSDLINIYNREDGLFYPYELTVISSQIKQEILKKIQSSIKSLSEAKKKGRKVGKLKFKSYVNIPFVQFNSAYYLSDNAKNLSIQGHKKMSFHLNRNKNLTQLSKNLKLTNKVKNISKNKEIKNNNVNNKNKKDSNNQYFNQVSLKKLLDLEIIEIANAELISSHKKDDYSLNITIYFKPEYLEKAQLFQGTNVKDKKLLKLIKETQIGADAGVANEVTINFDEPYSSVSLNTREPISKHQKNKLKNLKKYTKKFNRTISKAKKAGKLTRNNSRGYYINSLKNTKRKMNNLQKSILNHKVGTVNKITSFMDLFKSIGFQDEMIKTWYGNKTMKFSSPIQRGILGKTYAKLKNNYSSKDNKTTYKYRQLNKRLRTTKTCICGFENKNITLQDRVYICPKCEYKDHRYTHSSYIINHAQNHIDFDMTEYIETYMNSKVVPDCGTQSVDYGTVVLDSNLGQMTTSVNTKKIYGFMLSKLKSQNIKITLNDFYQTTKKPRPSGRGDSPIVFYRILV